MINETDESAFPTVQANNPFSSVHTASSGMSLRDWFAGLAMQGLLASETEESTSTYPGLSVMAYLQADAMMEARKKLG